MLIVRWRLGFLQPLFEFSFIVEILETVFFMENFRLAAMRIVLLGVFLLGFGAGFERVSDLL